MGEIVDFEREEVINRQDRPEPANIYERLQNDALAFSEAVLVREKIETIEVGTTQLPQVFDDKYYKVEVIRDASKEVEEKVLVTTSLFMQPQETEDHEEYFVETTPTEALGKDIEVSFETTEQEMFSRLLIELLVPEVNVADQDNEALAFCPVDVVNPDESLNAPLENKLNPLDKIVLFLENYPPEVSEQASQLIGSISEAVSELKQEDMPEDDKELLVVKLEQTIQELFATLSIELNEDQVKQFVELLLSSPIPESQPPVSRRHDIDYLNRLGTWEYKLFGQTSLLGGLVQLANSQLKHFELIGKCSLQACLS